MEFKPGEQEWGSVFLSLDTLGSIWLRVSAIWWYTLCTICTTKYVRINMDSKIVKLLSKSLKSARLVHA